MKKFKSLFVSLLVLSMVTAGLAGCGGKKVVSGDKEGPIVEQAGEKEIIETAEPTDSSALIGSIPIKFPLVTEPTSFDVLAGIGKIDFDDIFVWQEYEKMTGIKINWTNVASGERKEKISTALASGEEYDLILKGKVSSEIVAEYGDQGLIVDLMEDNMLEKHAPNAWAYFKSNPDTMASIMTPEGSIYALPQVNSGPELRVSRKVFINKRWLKNLGMELPTTTDELYELALAFKEQDANGNGDLTDEVPICTQDWYGFMDMLYGAFGVVNRGVHNVIVDWDYEKEDVRLVSASDDYKDLLMYANKLYTEGLVDEELFTMSAENWTTKIADDRVGIFAFTNLSSLPGNMTEDWIGLEEALEGPKGHKLWSPIRANYSGSGNAMIPSTSDKVAEVLQWLDYFWTDEGSLFYHYGIEGETFVAKEDGTYDFVDSIYAEMESGASYDDIVEQYTPYPGGGNPTVEMVPYFGGGEAQPIPAQSARDMFEYRAEEFWPEFTFTAAESSEIAIIQTDIKKYKRAARTEFITGTKSFDEWDSYLKSLENMGSKRLLEIYSDAVKRFEALK